MSHEWPADHVERRPVAALVPYARNARTHSPAQVDQIAASIREWGWTTPVLVDEQGGIIAGHGRILAAQKLGIPDVPTMVAAGWSEAQKRAYVLADNKLALNAGWDDELLRVELGDLKLEGFDLPLIGFGDDELASLLAEPKIEVGSAVGDEERLTEDQEEILNGAWKQLVRDWACNLAATLPEGRVSTTFSRGFLLVHFARALLLGEKVPRSAALAYHPHRTFTSGDKGAVTEVIAAAADNPAILKSLRWAMNERPSYDAIVSGKPLPIHGHRVPADFPVELARDLYNHHLVGTAGRVLDPCHGWGGRAIGFLLSNAAVSYTGFDVAEETQDGVRKMINDCLALAPHLKKETKLNLVPFEDAVLDQDSYDFVLTSPPYYDVEKYPGDKSSWRRYETFEDWVAGFYRPLIGKTFSALRDGGAFALQVGSQSYPLARTANEIAIEVGFSVEENALPTLMTNNFAETRLEDGEVVVLLRKPVAGPRKQKRKEG